MDNPMGHCSICGKQFPVLKLKELPEVEAYQKELALFLLHGGADAPCLDEAALFKKYGFNSTSLFCPSCLADLCAKSK